MVPITKLIPLHELDLKLDAANACIDAKKQKIQKMQKDIQADSELILKKKALLKKIQLRKRAAETEFENLNEEIKTSDLKMKSAGLSPASYAALEKEMSTQRSKASKVETSILEDMDKIEMLEKDTVKGDKVVAGRKVHLEDVKKRVSDEILVIRKEIDIIKTERSQISLKLDSDTLEPYEELRLAKKGQVIFDTDTPSCPACGMGLPGSFVNAASLHDEAEKCDYCHVLLHWTGLRN